MEIFSPRSKSHHLFKKNTLNKDEYQNNEEIEETENIREYFGQGSGLYEPENEGKLKWISRNFFERMKAFFEKDVIDA